MSLVPDLRLNALMTKAPELPPELRDIAARELNETPATRACALTELRQLLASPSSSKLQLHRQDEAFLVMYLRWSKFDAKKAFARIKALNKWIQSNAPLLGDWTQYCAEDFRGTYSKGFMKAGPGHAEDGAVVIWLLPAKLQPEDLPDPSVLLKYCLWTLHRAVDDVYMQVSGQLIIETFQGMTYRQALGLCPGIVPHNIIVQGMTFMTSCAPYRLKGIWLFHQSSLLTLLMSLVRPFMSQKMKERICIFGTDYSALHAAVDPALLPPDFGGTSSDDGWEWFNATQELEQRERALSKGLLAQREVAVNKGLLAPAC